MVITLRKSKTNQFNEREHKVALNAIHGSGLCLVEALRAMFLHTSTLPKTALAFQIVGNGLVKPLVHSMFFLVKIFTFVISSAIWSQCPGSNWIRSLGLVFGCLGS
jgi:hypothetical protein